MRNKDRAIQNRDRQEARILKPESTATKRTQAAQTVVRFSAKEAESDP
jgi:hypothetical protein